LVKETRQGGKKGRDLNFLVQKNEQTFSNFFSLNGPLHLRETPLKYIEDRYTVFILNEGWRVRNLN
jgi:hypothetical protein